MIRSKLDRGRYQEDAAVALGGECLDRHYPAVRRHKSNQARNEGPMSGHGLPWIAPGLVGLVIVANEIPTPGVIYETVVIVVITGRIGGGTGILPQPILDSRMLGIDSRIYDCDNDAASRRT